MTSMLHICTVGKNSLHSYFSLCKETARMLLELIKGLGYMLPVEQCKGLSGNIAMEEV